MAKKSLVILAGVGVAAAVAGVYVARRHRPGGTIADFVESTPIAAAVDNARRFANDWRGGDRLTEQLVSAVDDKVAAAR